MKPSILFVFRPGRQSLLQQWQAGERPNDMLYGFSHITAAEFDAQLLERDDSRWDWKRRLFYPLDLQLSYRIHMGFSVHFVIDHLPTLRQANVIVSVADSLGLPMAMFKAWGRLKTPLIYISQGLTDRLSLLPPRSLTFRMIRAVYGRFLRSVERFIVLGEGAKAPLVELFGLDPEHVFCAPFGVDENFWTPAPQPIRTGGPARTDYILSVGSDFSRDYPTLIAALEGQPTKIVTRLRVDGVPKGGSIEVSSAYSDLELRELYRRARFVVTPLLDVAQPSGQSATLQAMACGKAVILTRTLGLWEPDHMRHNENCYLIPPNDPQALRNAIHYLSQNPAEAERLGQNARRTVEERYTSRAFATRLEQHIREVLA